MSICAQPPEPVDPALMPSGDDHQVVQAAFEWLHGGHSVALVTVVRTWGSSPRPPGALLAMNAAGEWVGSVSGGCVEDTLVRHLCRGEIAGPRPTWIDFGVDREEATRIGLPCGGRLELLVEHLLDPQSMTALRESLMRGELVVRHVILPDGKVRLEKGKGGPEFFVSGNEVVKTFGPAWRLLLIGDGQLARHLAAMAGQLGYGITICDPREGLPDVRSLPGVSYSREMPDDAVRTLGDASRTAIVTLTHDPRQDDLGLSAALESKAFYIGALGSRRSAEARRKRLASLGYLPGQLARIHGPAGLYIGSKRPAEIALSILAEITALRNGATQQVAIRKS